MKINVENWNNILIEINKSIKSITMLYTIDNKDKNIMFRYDNNELLFPISINNYDMDKSDIDKNIPIDKQNTNEKYKGEFNSKLLRIINKFDFDEYFDLHIPLDKNCPLLFHMSICRDLMALKENHI